MSNWLANAHYRAIAAVILLFKMHIPHGCFDHFEATEILLKLRNKHELGKSLFKGNFHVCLKQTPAWETKWPNYKMAIKRFGQEYTYNGGAVHILQR